MPGLSWIQGALVVPCSASPGRSGWTIDGGVYDALGAPVPAARHRGEPFLDAAPASLCRDDLPATPGRWLFGGWLQAHFGHFMAFSIGRLWAVAELAGQVDGVAFLRLPDRPNETTAASPLASATLRDVLALLGVGEALPARMIETPERFEALAVPEQALLGAGSPAAENAAFVAMLRRMQDHPSVRPGPPVPGIYVSRSRLGPGPGGILFEELVEANLRAEGYDVIHPEQLPIPAQVARYAAAERLIFAEGSAIHLGVGFAGPETPVALIRRRPPTATRGIGYLAAAGLRRGVFIDAIRGAVTQIDDHGMAPSGVWSALAVLDFAALRDALVEAGFCHGRAWKLPDAAEQAARIEAEIAERRRAMPRRRFGHVPREAFLDARQRRRRTAGARPATAPG